MNRQLSHDARKLFVASMGFKKGKRASTALVLLPSELPGSGWTSKTMISIRSAVVGIIDEAAKRARKQGCISAWGWFSNERTSQYLLIKVGPMANVIDAQSKVASFPVVMAERSKVVEGMIDHHSVDGLTLASGEIVVGYEHEISVGKVSGFNFKDVVGNVANIVFTVECSGPDGGWPWDDVISVANLQHEKILKVQPTF
jgi:hypothetical protein